VEDVQEKKERNKEKGEERGMEGGEGKWGLLTRMRKRRKNWRRKRMR
jgi:hypothetical protein